MKTLIIVIELHINSLPEAMLSRQPVLLPLSVPVNRHMAEFSDCTADPLQELAIADNTTTYASTNYPQLPDQKIVAQKLSLECKSSLIRSHQGIVDSLSTYIQDFPVSIG